MFNSLRAKWRQDLLKRVENLEKQLAIVQDELDNHVSRLVALEVKCKNCEKCDGA